MHRFANPARFMRLSEAVLPWSAALTVVLLVIGVPWALLIAPPDYQQGESARIMYVHVPAAWMAMFVYTTLAAASASALIWKHPLGDLVARAASPVGAWFTFLTLVTGSLWGKPMWGAWWVWDARLTSVLILLFLYLGHIALLNAFEDQTRGERAAAILALVGLVNVPIIKWSVDWWNTLHQPSSVTKLGVPSIHPSLLWPLLVMGLAFTSFFVTVLIIRVRAEFLARKLRVLRLSQAAQRPDRAEPSMETP
jgi:heme exporter protein C